MHKAKIIDEKILIGKAYVWFAALTILTLPSIAIRQAGWRAYRNKRVGRRIQLLAGVLFQSLVMSQLSGFVVAQGQMNNSVAESPPSSELGPSDEREMENFISQLFEEEIRKNRIPGAAFVLVKDGNIFFSKGYGYADLERKIPVEADQTLFRVASISKLITATAVMQLVEQGKIDLQADVNRYLGSFQIINRYKKPITVAHLLSHIDGFDLQWYVGWFARSEKELKPLKQYLHERLPPQIDEPGKTYFYSDVGMTLAGYIIEEVSGVSFFQYVEKNLFKPLDMERSTFLQPLPPKLESGLAIGYEKSVNGYRRMPFLYYNSAPAGALSLTATDMAHFMIAHLDRGQYRSVRVLSEASVRQMHTQRFNYHPKLPGVAFGFHVSGTETYPLTLHHRGSIPGYNSLVRLLPDQNLGFFIAVNAQRSDVVDRISNRLLEHYYPSSKKPNDFQLAANSQNVILPFTDLQKNGFTGLYRDDQYPRYTLIRLALLGNWAEYIRVEVSADDSLVLYPDGTKWRQIEPLVFKQVDKNKYLAFRQDNRGNITDLLTDDEIARYEKLNWYDRPAFHWVLIAIFGLIFMTSPLLWFRSRFTNLLSRGRRSTYGVSDQVPEADKLARGLTILVSFLNLGFIIGMIQFFLRIDNYTLIWGLPFEARALLLIPPVAMFVALCLLLLVALAWKRNYWSFAGRCYYSVVTVAAIGFLNYLYYWDLLNLRF